MAKLELIAGIPQMTAEGGSPYDESIYYASGLTANTSITLPNSGSYTSATAKDLLVTLNGVMKEITRDITVVGSGPTYTQIQFIYALPVDAVVRFRKGI